MAAAAAVGGTQVIKGGTQSGAASFACSGVKRKVLGRVLVLRLTREYQIHLYEILLGQDCH